MDYTDTALGAAIKALDEVVAPAVVASDSQATEQLSLVIDYLTFLRARVDHLSDRHRFDLRHALHLAHEAVHASDSWTSRELEHLQREIASAEDVLARGDVTSPQLRDAGQNIGEALRVLLRRLDDCPDAVRGAIESGVVRGTAERIEMERAWFLPFGFEPDPSTVQPLAAVLGLEGPVVNGP